MVTARLKTNDYLRGNRFGVLTLSGWNQAVMSQLGSFRPGRCRIYTPVPLNATMKGPNPMTTTREISQEFLTRLADGNASHTAALFAEKVDFLCAGTEDAEWIRPRDTREGMEDMFNTMQMSFSPDDRSASLTSFIIDGNDAVITGHVTQRLRSNNVAFTIPFALHLTVESGQITRYHIYEDSLTVANAVRAKGTT